MSCRESLIEMTPVRLLIALLVVLGIEGCGGDSRPSSQAGDVQVELTPVFTGIAFDVPILMLQAPGDDSRWYVVEQSGLIKTFESGDVSASIFADLTDRIVFTGIGDERGLLGMAFHPEFEANGEVYLYYTNNSTGLRSIVGRYVSADGGMTISVPDFSREDVVISLPQPASNHNGGNIAFGPDGFLYIGLGDGGGANDVFENGLNTQTLLGSMLRIDVDSPPAAGRNYAIPADNPFVANAQVRDEIFAFGLRNPWRWSFDSLTGLLYLGDVGQRAREEVDVIVGGMHYGWGCFEASLRNTRYPGVRVDCNSVANNLPIHEYPRSEGVAVVGGFVYRGRNAGLAGLVGKYLFADYGLGTIWGLDPAAVEPSSTNRVLLETNRQISSFAQDNAGELYVLFLSEGTVSRIDPASGR